jgi:hypothetical protein
MQIAFFFIGLGTKRAIYQSFLFLLHGLILKERKGIWVPARIIRSMVASMWRDLPSYFLNKDVAKQISSQHLHNPAIAF